MTTLRSVVGMALCAGVLVGCDPPAPSAAEPHGSVTSKYLAPSPVLAIAASKATRRSLGIQEWRLYRGRGALFLTGYDGKGKAVKGLAAMFTRNDVGRISQLALRVNDGSKASAIHDLARAETTPVTPVGTGSQELTRQAVLDLARVGVAANHERRTHAAVVPQTTCAESSASALVNLITACLSSSTTDAALRKQCISVAQSLGVSLACKAPASAPIPTSSAAPSAAPSAPAPTPAPVGVTGLPTGVHGIDDIDLGMCGGDPTCTGALGSIDDVEQGAPGPGIGGLFGDFGGSLFNVPGVDSADMSQMDPGLGAVMSANDADHRSAGDFDEAGFTSAFGGGASPGDVDESGFTSAFGGGASPGDFDEAGFNSAFGGAGSPSGDYMGEDTQFPGDDQTTGNGGDYMGEDTQFAGADPITSSPDTGAVSFDDGGESEIAGGQDD